MTLGFTTKFPDGSPTMFEQKILIDLDPACREQYPDMLPKIHTFRMGHRWRAGMKMHMVTGNRTANRRQFNIGYPALETCNGTQDCIITCIIDPAIGFHIEIDGRQIENDLLFIANDGFNSPQQFWNWFGNPITPVRHVGQIIHFTNFRY